MDQKAISVIRNLALDMIQTSGSGHPGITMSSAPILYTLFTKHLKVNPAVQNWINRDRFVLSASIGTELLYSVMFLSGYPLMIEDLKDYRKINSKTPSRPDVKTPGIDFNTGVFGEGFASSVGIALAEKIYESKYNYKSKGLLDKTKIGKLFDYYTYVLVNDEDLMEGVSYEAASFAGTHKLGKLIVLYDSSGMNGDGVFDNTFSEGVMSRFSALGWDTSYVKNGSSIGEIDKAINKAKRTYDKPSIIKIKTIMGEGLSNQGTNDVYEGILSKEVLSEYKEKTGAGSIPFAILKEPASHIRDQVVNRGIKVYDSWKNTFEEYKKVLTEQQLAEINNIDVNGIALDLTKMDIEIDYENKELLRDSNYKIMNIIGSNIYNFLSGSSNLFTTCKTYLENQNNLLPNDPLGKNIFFGDREHVMGSVLNGLAVSGFRPCASTYMIKSDYMKPSIRTTALMNLPVTYVLTHDSVTIGSSGPSYQPVEQLASLRAMPNLYVFRPADIKEIIGTWNIIINNKIPAVISLAKTEVKAEQGTSITEVSKGAYIAGKEQAIVNAVIIATGAELQVAKSVQVKLLHEGIDVRIISMPCMELYNNQPQAYKNELFPNGVPIFVIEYGSSFGWEKFVPSSDYLFTINKFGISASKDDILKYLKVDMDSIVDRIKSLVK